MQIRYETHTREAAARCCQSHLSLINTHTHYGKSILSVEAEQGEELEGEWQVVRPSKDYRDLEHPQVGEPH